MKVQQHLVTIQYFLDGRNPCKKMTRSIPSIIDHSKQLISNK